jgi:hypothetical protein
VGFLARFRRSGARAGDDLRERMLLVPAPESAAEPAGLQVLEEERELSFVVVADEAGRQVLPAFTSEDELRRWQPGGSRYVALQGKDLVEILARSEWDRMVIDGAGPDARVLTREDAARSLAPASYTVPAGTMMLVGQPADAPPDELVRGLRDACEREPAVSEAYLYQVAMPERDEPPHLTVGLRLATGADAEDASRIVQSLGQEVRPEAFGYAFLDFQLLDDDMLETARSAGLAVLEPR